MEQKNELDGFLNDLEKEQDTENVRRIFLDSSLKRLRDFPKHRLSNFSWFHVKNVYNSLEKTAENSSADKSDKGNEKTNEKNEKQVKFFENLSQMASDPIFREIRLPEKKFKVEPFKSFSAEELDFWKISKPLSVPIKLNGLSIVHGKKIGRTLGIPTGDLISKSGRAARDR